MRPRLLLSAWLFPRIISAPLIHIHIPDTTDEWTALRSAGAHTVVTPALPGEYSLPVHATHQAHSGLSQRTVNSPEIDIGIFDETEQSKQAKNISPLRLSGQLSAIPAMLVFNYKTPQEFRKLRLPQLFNAPRAPPPSFR